MKGAWSRAGNLVSSLWGKVSAALQPKVRVSLFSGQLQFRAVRDHHHLFFFLEVVGGVVKYESKATGRALACAV